MPALIDAQYLRDTFNIHKDVKDARLTPYIGAASRRLKKWVGDSAYGDTEEEDLLKLAEATLTMHFLIRNLNTNIRPKGLVATESVEGNVTIRYFNPTEMAQSETGYFEQTRELVVDLMVGSDIPPPPESVE